MGSWEVTSIRKVMGAGRWGQRALWREFGRTFGVPLIRQRLYRCHFLPTGHELSVSGAAANGQPTPRGRQRGGRMISAPTALRGTGGSQSGEAGHKVLARRGKRGHREAAPEGEHLGIGQRVERTDQTS
ncbi:hypothetical protein CE91St43_29360 [Oscillospiraceae bacterium]|nr:hypothetical protein CE91St43_29360 [Oscillospiraceae bacterium]